MKFLYPLTIIAAAATVTSAANLPGLMKRQGNIDDQPTCGTTADATLSDCQYLYDHWPDFPDWSPTCHYFDGVVSTAWRPACNGNCCIYTDWNGGLWADIHTAVSHLLDCGDKAKNTVNGVLQVVDSGRVCLSNGNGCGDCFED
ncbi:hypothetical protein GLOTRDRAFT_95323 [Gloeophyllum trabeum ATCC 11539]|uniref:Uncharacterized protein n=1 Tax=Gloeophyllum trabeum (strain ATCC 11539 / FP-39264 / Madison 617) TaxID=670483 RepID=S7Q0S0_GLOTA|nr:uncharacterized protein GLOTRDRAFT_95323 [Gloeophyllum trabeum ATCC 11539]EPQ53363.1 hypothetical protein GLOTRDRAFT_95323 [Gloeophyllum trabeum ATCC 11539]